MVSMPSYRPMPRLRSRSACFETSCVNSPERMPVETHNPFTGYLWGALAVLTCPCHLPILPPCLPARAPALSSGSIGVLQPPR